MELVDPPTGMWEVLVSVVDVVVVVGAGDSTVVHAGSISAAAARAMSAGIFMV